MKAATIMSFVSRRSGGLFDAVRRLTQSEEAYGWTHDVFGLRDDRNIADESEWHPLKPRTYPVVGPEAFGIAPRMLKELLESDAIVTHLHGLWMYPSTVTARWRHVTGRPVVISPHGMLDKWALRNSRWKKRFALRLFEWKNLSQAACLRALCPAEADSIRKFGLANPIAVIPNGVDIPDKAHVAAPPWQKDVADSRVLLFFGRLHPKKGLTELLLAWREVAQLAAVRDWVLVICGWGEESHENFFRRLVVQHDVRRVVFAGPQFGNAKTESFARCDLFVLPSFSEGLPMTVLEAWAAGKPVVMSRFCNLQVGFDVDAAIKTEPAVKHIADVLSDVLTAAASDLEMIGSRGLDLVKRHFTWNHVGEEMATVYDWLTKGGQPPASVLL